MVVIPPHDAPKVVCVPRRLLCTVVVVDIDEDAESENAANLVRGVITMYKLRDPSVDLGMISRELFARVFCAEISIRRRRMGG